MTTTFQAKALVRSDVRDLMAIAESHFSKRGFRVITKSATVLELEGPGLNSTRQNPLLGASMIRLRAAPGSLELEAELDAVRRLCNFMNTAILAPQIVLTVGFLTIFPLVLPGRNLDWLGLIPLLIILPLFLFVPWMRRSLIKRTEHALDTFLHNLSMLTVDPCSSAVMIR